MPPEGKRGAQKEKKTKTQEELDQEAELVRMRKDLAIFPSALLSPELTERSLYLATGEGNKNHATKLLHAAADSAEGQVKFFSNFFMSRLVPPFLEFFTHIMEVHGLLLLQLHPNAITTLSVFAHLCENFIGVVPSVALFRHYYIPKIDNDNRSGSITWHFKNGMSSEYIGGHLMTRWQDWRANWCKIQMEDPPAFYAVPQGAAVHNPHWGDRGPQDELLGLSLFGKQC